MRAFLSACLAGAAALALTADVTAAPAPAAPTPAAVLTTYGDVAQAMYEDSLSSARTMQTAINAFLANPTPATLTAARNAWKTARVPYLQTEGLRFGNAIVDEWEVKVNAWPLDEGLIDYVAMSYGTTSDENPLYTLNVIANRQIRIGARQVNASVINAALLREIQMAQGVEANVATGYHAIEFLLWGQDLHGTGPGAGERPATDYSTTACTHGNCDRRAAYLRTATELLIADLTEMARRLGAGRQGADGAVRQRRERRPCDHSHRPRQHVVRRARGRADEARTHPARSGRRAGLLLRQHAQFALLRSGRHDQFVARPLHAHRRPRRAGRFAARSCRGEECRGRADAWTRAWTTRWPS